jgi:hypothetical protein
MIITHNDPLGRPWPPVSTDPKKVWYAVDQKRGFTVWSNEPAPLQLDMFGFDGSTCK